MAGSEHYQDPKSNLTEDAERLEHLEAETLRSYDHCVTDRRGVRGK